MAYQKNEDIKKALDEVYSVMTAGDAFLSVSLRFCQIRRQKF